jgi:ferredoxin-NADP reductase
LYVTGDAENLYGDAADKVMPRSTLVTRIRVTGYTYVQAGLNLVATQSHPSPYNPPIKYLASELHKFGKSTLDTRRDIALVDAQKETHNISTFIFELQDGEPYQILPGHHAILDFSAENSNGYRHMADEAPQSINDDYIRSWTISSIPEIDDNGEYLPSMKFSCTIKNKYGGAISPMLHRWAQSRRQTYLSIKFVGVEGAFSCFDEHHHLKHEKLLFIAGGVGITPFMSMLEVIRRRNVKADIVFLFSARGDEAMLGKQFQDVGIETLIFNTERKRKPGIETLSRRIEYQDVAAVPDVANRGVYLCGPDGFMNAMKGYLEQAGVNTGNVFVESFAF